MVYVRCANELRLSNSFGTCNIKILHVLEEEIESDRALWHLNVTCSFKKIAIEAFKITFHDDLKDMRILASDFRKLYETKEIYDIILCTPEKSFPAHKAILGARLPKLTESLHINSEGINDLDSWTHVYKINDSSIVSSDDSDESKPESVFLDMKAETLESLLEYAYTGSISHDMTEEIVAAIDDYDIVSLSEVFCSVPDKILFDTCICVDEKIFKWRVTDVNSLFSGRKINGPQFFLGLDKGTQIAIDAVLCLPNICFFLRISRFSDEETIVSTHHALQRIPSTEDHLLRYLCYDIARLYDVRSPKFGDITFQIREDTLYAHKAVLVARSATFARKFQIIDLHDAAQKYQVTSLIAKCSAQLRNSITDQNSKTIFDLAVLYSDPELEVAVAKFIRPRKVEVLDMDEWVLPSVDSRYFRMLTRLRECEEGSHE
ncbi:hypothetical protein CEXT_500821 [Caerostris extrusa]|uniref:BTB domain-containing protein n=1 Tax=Caerostris extrusa TaxID=172846 RepID=A0AAV4MTZ0_CAEEX|nr:hypothetical protein CEXT_500821 [Caerostris extrusa]